MPRAINYMKHIQNLMSKLRLKIDFFVCSKKQLTLSSSFAPIKTKL